MWFYIKAVPVIEQVQFSFENIHNSNTYVSMGIFLFKYINFQIPHPRYFKESRFLRMDLASWWYGIFNDILFTVYSLRLFLKEKSARTCMLPRQTYLFSIFPKIVYSFASFTSCSSAFRFFLESLYSYCWMKF